MQDLSHWNLANPHQHSLFCFFPSYIFTTRRCGDDDQPPKGGEHGPQLRPILRWACAASGLAYPHADKRRGAPPGDACGIVVAPMALVASLRPRIPAYQGAQVAAVWVGTSRPASWACRGATAAGNAMAKHGARVARRRDCAAFGYVVNRATSDRVQRLRPLLAGRQ